MLSWEVSNDAGLERGPARPRPPLERRWSSTCGVGAATGGIVCAAMDVVSRVWLRAAGALTINYMAYQLFCRKPV